MADYLDGDLHAGERDAFLRHCEGCAGCALLLDDAEAALAFIARAAEADPPAALVGRILYATNGHATNGGRELSPHPGGIRGWINRTFAPVLQPRIVMGGMLTVMSFALVLHSGVMQGGGLNPVRVWTSLDDRTHRIYDRAVKDYESIRLVYEVRNQLDEWQAPRSEEEAAMNPDAGARRLDIADRQDRN